MSTDISEENKEYGEGWKKDDPAQAYSCLLPLISGYNICRISQSIDFNLDAILLLHTSFFDALVNPMLNDISVENNKSDANWVDTILNGRRFNVLECLLLSAQLKLVDQTARKYLLLLSHMHSFWKKSFSWRGQIYPAMHD